MHFEHEAGGDKMFVDYAGKKLHYVEYGTGGKSPNASSLSPFSGRANTPMGGKLPPSQQKEDFIASVQNALHYYGGVP